MTCWHEAKQKKTCGDPWVTFVQERDRLAEAKVAMLHAHYMKCRFKTLVRDTALGPNVK